MFVCLSVIAAYLITHHPERFALDLSGPQYIKVTGYTETRGFGESKGQHTLAYNVYLVALNEPHKGKIFWVKNCKPSAKALLSALHSKLGKKTPVVLEGWVSKQEMITSRVFHGNTIGDEVTFPEGFVPCDGVMDVEQAICYPEFIEFCRDEVAHQYQLITDCSRLEAEHFVIELIVKAKIEFKKKSERSFTDEIIEAQRDELEKDIKEFENELRENQIE